MNPLKKKPMFTLICKFKARNMSEGFFWRNIKFFLTTVNIFFVFFQGILALEPLPTAICLAYEPGIPSACLLVLFITTWENKERKKAPPHQAASPETRAVASTESWTHAALQSSKATSCITYSREEWKHLSPCPVRIPKHYQAFGKLTCKGRPARTWQQSCNSDTKPRFRAEGSIANRALETSWGVSWADILCALKDTKRQIKEKTKWGQHSTTYTGLQ